MIEGATIRFSCLWTQRTFQDWDSNAPIGIAPNLIDAALSKVLVLEPGVTINTIFYVYFFRAKKGQNLDPKYSNVEWKRVSAVSTNPL